MAGMTPQSYANFKSRVREALRHAAPQLAPARSWVKLTGEWASLERLLPQRKRCLLSRFMRFCQASGFAPGDVGEEVVEAFAEYLEHEAMRGDHAKVVRETRRAWNRAADAIAEWPERRLAPPEPKLAPYWLALSDLPAALQQEIANHLHRLAHPDPFLGQTQALAASTLRQHESLFVTLASALVASGIAAAELTSIATLVRPDRLEQALRFLHRRAGGRVSEQILQIAYRVRRIAAHAGLPQEDLARLDQILASVRREYPAPDGLTAKNRCLLEHLDDPAFVDRLVTLPSRLAEVARRRGDPRRAASFARDAVAVELLLTCSMRIGNLVDLRAGGTIRKFGEGRDARCIIDIPAEVKNRQPLRYTLLPESVQLLAWFLATWHQYWCGVGSPSLFPGGAAGTSIRISSR